MAYTEDDDKKKQGSSSSSSSKKPDPSGGKPADYGGYVRYDYGGSSTPTSDSSSGQYSGVTVHYSPSAQKTYSGTWSGRNSGGGTRGGGTRGSSAYNQQQQQQQQQTYAPANKTQALYAPKGTQYGIQGINGLSQRPDVTAQGKWYAGERPTDVEAMARVIALNGGEQMQQDLMNARYDSKSEYYQPNAGITNEAVRNLHELGIEIPPGGLTDEFFEKIIPLVTPYYNPTIDSTTGNPKKPRKNAPKEEKIAYWAFQAYGDQANTTKALNEKAALQEEINHLVNSNYNYSDEEVLAHVGWSKYPTLQKMDNDARDGVPMMLNADIDYSSDYLNGMVWAARNGGGTGSSFYDSVYALLGEGQFYQPDEETIAKRTFNSDSYAPYSFGPASDDMKEAGLYFGTYSFTNEQVEELSNRYMRSMNPKDVSMMRTVRKANDFTNKCEAELEDLLYGKVGKDGKRTGSIDDIVGRWTYKDKNTFDENVDMIVSKIYDNGNFKNLEKLDDSLINDELIDTTRPIDYRKQDIRSIIADKLRAKMTAPTGAETVNDNKSKFQMIWDSVSGVFGGKPQTPDPSELAPFGRNDSENAVVESKQSTANNASKTIWDVGTAAENAQWSTGEINQQEVSDQIGGYINKGVPTGTGGQVFLDLTDGKINGTDYINNRSIIYQYEDNDSKIKSLDDEINNLKNERDNLRGDFGLMSRDELRETFEKNSTQSASLFGGGIFKKNPQPEEDDEEEEPVVAEYRPAVADMTLDQKMAWIQKKINNVSTTPEEQQGLRNLLEQYRSSINWNDNDEAVQMQRQMLDDTLAMFIGEPATAAQDTGVDPEIATERQNAIDAIAKLNPEMAGKTFEEASAWLDTQSGDSADYLYARYTTDIATKMGEKRVREYQKEEMQSSYDEAFDFMKSLRKEYETNGTVWNITGSGGDTDVPAYKVLDFVASFADYVPYQYSDENYYDYLVNKKGYTKDEAYAEAEKNADGYRVLRNTIQMAMDVCDQKGVSIPDEYRKHMNQAITMIDNQIDDGIYYAIRTNKGFKEETDELAKPKTEDEPGFVAPQNVKGTLNDMEWAVFTTPGTNVSRVLVKEMNEDEQRTFLYIAKHQGGAAAQRYYDHLTDEYGAVTTRRGREMTEAMYNDFRALDEVTFNIGGTVATIAMHPFQAMSGIYTAGMAMMGKVANTDSAWNALSKASARERETIKTIAGDTMEQKYGKFVGDLTRNGYDLVVGVADNIWDAAVMNTAGFADPLGDAGEGASIAKKVSYNIINGTVTALPLGLNAVGMEYIDAIGRGLPPEQAYLLAGISGLAEALTEGAEIESFTDAYNFATGNGFKGFLKRLALSIGNEAVGEGTGQFIENLSDDAIAGHRSNRNQLISLYESQGYSNDEATRMANHAMTTSIVKSAIMGGLSGGLSTTLTSTAGAITYAAASIPAYRETNAEYLANISNGLRDIGFRKDAADQITKKLFWKSDKDRVQRNIELVKAVKEKYGINTYIFDRSDNVDKKIHFTHTPDGYATLENASIYLFGERINKEWFSTNVMHELLHVTERTKYYPDIRDSILRYEYGTDYKTAKEHEKNGNLTKGDKALLSDVRKQRDEYRKLQNNPKYSDDDAIYEVIAYHGSEMLYGKKKNLDNFAGGSVGETDTVMDKIGRKFWRLVSKLQGLPVSENEVLDSTREIVKKALTERATDLGNKPLESHEKETVQKLSKIPETDEDAISMISDVLNPIIGSDTEGQPDRIKELAERFDKKQNETIAQYFIKNIGQQSSVEVFRGIVETAFKNSVDIANVFDGIEAGVFLDKSAARVLLNQILRDGATADRVKGLANSGSREYRSNEEYIYETINGMLNESKEDTAPTDVLEQYDDLVTILESIDGEENFDSTVTSSSVNTLNSMLGYADSGKDAEQAGDMETASEFYKKSGASLNALSAILERNGIDQRRFAFLNDEEALANLKKRMAMRGVQGPERGQVGQYEISPIEGTEGTTAEDQRNEQSLQRKGLGTVTTEEVLPDNEGTTAEDQRQDQALQRQGLGTVTVEEQLTENDGTTSEEQRAEQAQLRQGLGAVTEEEALPENDGTTAEDQRYDQMRQRQGLGRVDEGVPEINPAETMEVVNRGPDELRPIQGPIQQRVNPFTTEFKRNLSDNDRMKGQLLALSSPPSTPTNGTSILASVFGSVMSAKDDISNAQAMAAARSLMTSFKDAGDNVFSAVKGIIVTAADQGISNTDAVYSIQVAALTDGDANRILSNTIEIGDATPNRVKELVNAGINEAKTSAREMFAKAREEMVTSIMHRMAGDGALNNVKNYEKAEADAHARMKESQKNVDRQLEIVKANEEHLKEVQGPYLDDPADKTKRANFEEAMKTLGNSYTVLMQWQQQLGDRKVEHRSALNELNDVQQQAMTKLREEATREADERIAQVQAARQEREAQRQVNEPIAQAPVVEEQTAPEQVATGETTTEPITTEPTTTEATQETIQAEPSEDQIRADTGAPNPTIETKKDDTKIKSGAEIIEDLEKATGIKIDSRLKKYDRKERKTTKGYTRVGKNITHVLDANNVETAAHELGHKFSEIFNLKESAPVDSMVSYLENNDNKEIRAWIKSYKKEERAEESIAEFSKYWILDHDLAVKFAGKDFVEYWESQLANRGWLKPMQQAAQDLRLNRAATNGERAIANIAMTTKENISKFDKGMMGFMTTFADYTLPLLDMEVARKDQEGVLTYTASKDPRTLMLAKNSGSITNFAKNCMEVTMVNPEGDIVLREDGTPWGSFGDIVKDIPMSKAPTLAAIWELENAMDRKKYGKNIFADDIDVEKAYQELADANPELVEAAHQMHDWMNKFIQTWVVDTGMLGKDGEALWNKMKQMYPHWAPAFAVTKDQQSVTGKKDYQAPTSGMMRANGHTQQTLDPVLGCAEYVKRYITNYRLVEAYRGLIESANLPGFEAIMEPAQMDMSPQNETYQNQMTYNAVMKSINELAETGDISIEAVNKISEVFDHLPDVSFHAKPQNGNDVITVPMKDGTTTSWTVYQPELINTLTVTPPQIRNRYIRSALAVVGKLTGFISVNNTSRKLMFNVQNASSDSGTAMVTGHASGNPILFAFQWLKTAGYQLGQMIDEKNGKELDENMRLFNLFGRYASRFSIRDEDNQIELRRKMFKRNKDAKDFKEMAIDTLEAVSNFFENTTRLNEFLHLYDQLIKLGVSEYDARLIAGKASHEVSTDFKKSGSAMNTIKVAKTFVPFFNGQLQGVYKTVRMFSKENKGQRGKIAQRLVMGAMFNSLVMSVIRNLIFTPEEKKEYDLLTPYQRSKYHNVKIGNTVFKIKKSQDGIVQMADNVGEVLGNLLTGREGDELADFYNLAKATAENMVLHFDSAFDPIIDMVHGVTWSGQSTTDYELQGLSTVEQYNSSTPTLFRLLSNFGMIFGQKVGPQGYEYAAKQYGGGLGSIGIETLSLYMDDEFTASNFLNVVRNHFATSLSVDPAYSNSLASVYKANKTGLSEVISDASAGHYIAHFRNDLPPYEVENGVAEAKSLISSKGEITKINKEINALWREHEEILENKAMTKDERDKRARVVRVEINSLYLEANEIMSDYWVKYGYQNQFAENMGNTLNVLAEWTRIGKTKYKPYTDE